MSRILPALPLLFIAATLASCDRAVENERLNDAELAARADALTQEADRIVEQKLDDMGASNLEEAEPPSVEGAGQP